MLNAYLKSAQDVARQAGELLVNMMQDAIVREKGTKDLVTDADIAAQKLIQTRLLSAYPDHAWIGEEDENPSEPGPGQFCWVVDPLDGTVNYAHRFPNFAVSIGLVQSNEILVGVVYDPCAKELFSAARGQGANLNGKQIQPSRCRELMQAMVAASFPPNVQKDSREVDQFLAVLERSQSVRRLGSAALNLCYAACGRLDGYWTGRVKPWDVVAGVLICQESNAFLTNMEGNDFDIWKSDLLVASTPELHRELRDCLWGYGRS